jgi:hypothetical protein
MGNQETSQPSDEDYERLDELSELIDEGKRIMKEKGVPEVLACSKLAELFISDDPEPSDDELLDDDI